MIKELINAIEDGVPAWMIGHPGIAKTIEDHYQRKLMANHKAPIIEPPKPIVLPRRVLYHIKRDGKSLCKINTQNTIKWNEALNRDNLNERCCPECLLVFYARLARTLTVV